jgi:spoIIIJ-associated protein
MSEDERQAAEEGLGGELEPAEALEELLEEVVDALGLDVEVEVEDQESVLSGRIAGSDVGLFIGRRGQTIDAVQHLAQRIVFPGGPAAARVEIDADGYRARQAELLRQDAEEAAEEALRSGAEVELDSMPPFERRIVHEYLRERGGVQTQSEGEEPERYIVVSPLDG